MRDLSMEGVKCDQGIMPWTPKSSYTDHYIVYKYKPLKSLDTPFYSIFFTFPKYKSFKLCNDYQSKC